MTHLTKTFMHNLLLFCLYFVAGKIGFALALPPDNTTAISARVETANVVDDLTTGGTTVPLSAEQGKVLKGLVDSTVNITVDTKQMFFRTFFCSGALSWYHGNPKLEPE